MLHSPVNKHAPRACLEQLTPHGKSNEFLSWGGPVFCDVVMLERVSRVVGQVG